jgi:hypothetical protein
MFHGVARITFEKGKFGMKLSIVVTLFTGFVLSGCGDNPIADIRNARSATSCEGYGYVPETNEFRNCVAEESRAKKQAARARLILNSY